MHTNSSNSHLGGLLSSALPHPNLLLQYIISSRLTTLSLMPRFWITHIFFMALPCMRSLRLPTVCVHISIHHHPQVTTKSMPQLHKGEATTRLKHSPALEELEARWARYTKQQVARLLKDFDKSEVESLKYYEERTASIRFRLARLVKRHEENSYGWLHNPYELMIQKDGAKAQQLIRKNDYIFV